MKYLALFIVVLLPLCSAENYYYAGNTAYAAEDGSLRYLYHDRLGTDIHTQTLPFGQVAVDGKRFGFTGKEQDEGGLHYFGARYYDSDIGLFTSIDPITSNNAYQYVNNNPMNYVDQLGLEETAIIFTTHSYSAKSVSKEMGDAGINVKRIQYFESVADLRDHIARLPDDEVYDYVFIQVANTKYRKLDSQVHATDLLGLQEHVHEGTQLYLGGKLGEPGRKTQTFYGNDNGRSAEIEGVLAGVQAHVNPQKQFLWYNGEELKHAYYNPSYEYAVQIAGEYLSSSAQDIFWDVIREVDSATIVAHGVVPNNGNIWYTADELSLYVRGQESLTFVPGDEGYDKYLNILQQHINKGSYFYFQFFIQDYSEPVPNIFSGQPKKGYYGAKLK